MSSSIVSRGSDQNVGNSREAHVLRHVFLGNPDLIAPGLLSFGNHKEERAYTFWVGTEAVLQTKGSILGGAMSSPFI